MNDKHGTKKVAMGIREAERSGLMGKIGRKIRLLLFNDSLAIRTA
jgi:hypothetical protein